MKTLFAMSKVASLIVFGLLAATSARADIAPTTGLPPSIDLHYSAATFGGYPYFTASNTTTPSEYSGSILFDTSVTGSASKSGSFATYCVDLLKNVDQSSGWTNYTLAALPTTVASNLARLYQVASTPVSGLPDDQNSSAAFQAAVWEIAYETPTPGMNFTLTSGTFQGSFGYGSAINTKAETWLGAVNGFTGPVNYKAQQYISTAGQNQLVITSVPEPETYAMLIAGLGLMGAVARRRRQAFTPRG